MAKIVLATSLLWPEPKSDAPLRQALAERGHESPSVPWNGDDLSEFLNADLVLLRSCWDYYQAPQQFLAWLNHLEENSVKVLNPIPLVRWNFDKSYLFELRDNGFSVPETRSVDPRNHAEIRRVMLEQNWEQAILKPVSGQSGKFVEKLELEDFAKWEKSEMPTSRALLQDYQSDIGEIGETLLFFFEGNFSYAVQRLPKPVGGKTRIEIQVSDKVIQQASAVLKYLDEVPLYARIDGLIRGDNFMLMELELIEPSFAFETVPDKAATFVRCIERALD